MLEEERRHLEIEAERARMEKEKEPGLGNVARQVIFCLNNLSFICPHSNFFPKKGSRNKPDTKILDTKTVFKT